MGLRSSGTVCRPARGGRRRRGLPRLRRPSPRSPRRAIGRVEQACQHFETAITRCHALGALAWAELSVTELNRLRRAAPADVFRCEGSTWRLAFEGREAQLPHAKGLHDIAMLLCSPGCEVHV